jgi:hypothetical protein
MRIHIPLDSRAQDDRTETDETSSVATFRASRESRSRISRVANFPLKKFPEQRRRGH